MKLKEHRRSKVCPLALLKPINDQAEVELLADPEVSEAMLEKEIKKWTSDCALTSSQALVFKIHVMRMRVDIPLAAIRAQVEAALRSGQHTRKAIAASTLLCDIIGIQGNAVQAVQRGFAELWARCGRPGMMMNKENCPNFATFGAGGQGKTELCRDVVKLLPGQLQSFPGVTACVCLHISFGQMTTWESSDQRAMANSYGSAALPIWRRCLINLALASSLDDAMCITWAPRSVSELTAFFQSAGAAAFGVPESSVMVCVLLDEIMKVSSSERSCLLNEIATVQQESLLQKLPTFFLITSLEAAPIVDVLVTASKRPVTSIPLPVLEDLDREAVVDRLLDTILALWREADLSPAEQLQIRGAGMLRRLIQGCVHQTGNHFRALEDVVRSLITKFVPAQFNEDAARNLHELPPCMLQPVDLCKPLLLLLADPSTIFTIHIPTPLCSPKMGQAASELFIEHLLVGAEKWWAPEEALKRFLDYHAILVRERDPDNAVQIRPHVSLPLIFEAWALDEATVRYRYCTVRGPAKDGSITLDQIDRKRWSVDEAFRLALACLATLLRPSGKEANRMFEDLIIAVTFVRLVVLGRKFNSDEVSLAELLPGAIIVPWTREGPAAGPPTVHLDRHAPLTLCTSVVKPSAGATDVLDALLDVSLASLAGVFFVRQGKVDSKLIEAVGPLVHSGTQASRLLWSMKLRQANIRTTAEAILAGIHSEMRLREPRDGSYMAVAVTCQRAKIQEHLIPPGSIIIPADTLQTMLRPFGASYMPV
eukprot:m.112060 g.112060  ORF g.112060 m.112060 type:complete len:767 (-) comp9104_c0_seq1:130-2430(-)